MAEEIRICQAFSLGDMFLDLGNGKFVGAFAHLVNEGINFLKTETNATLIVHKNRDGTGEFDSKAGNS